ncbi:MAG: peptidase U32 family protein, partial [Candidatus Gracilibacteria bacterium]
MQKIEIMAPVGSFEALSAAIKAGCDSVYFGVEQLNMRARASHNFTLEELKEVAQICHKHGVRSYLTMNTLLYQHDLILMRKILDAAKAAEVSAIIIQDIAAIQYARSIGLSIHASTQLSISNYEAVKFYAQFADTLVLAREVDMEMMREICAAIKKDKLKGPAGELIRIEVFVHGALCIAQSGRCQMSLLQSNTSA